MSDENALATIETLNPVAVFSGGIDPLLERIATESRAQKLDISTEKGRKEVASLAYKIARSKTLLDDMGKALGEDAKRKLDAINADRKKARDSLDALKEEIRKPLTDWENADALRIAALEQKIKDIESIGDKATAECLLLPIKGMEEAAEKVAAIALIDWQEFKFRAKEAIEIATSKISLAIAQRKKHDEEQAELARLRAEAAAREQAERDARIAAEAAAKAKAEAEAKAAQEAKAAADKAEAEQKRVEAEKKAAEERAAKAEQEKLAAEAKAKADAAAALLKAEQEKIAAVEAERKRAEQEARAEAEAAAKREADKAHKTKINGEALADLVAAGLSEETAKEAIKAIAQGKIRNVKISY